MSMSNSAVVVGIMSGTSLDGVDIACCKIWIKNNKWFYKIIAAETVAYNKTWFMRLQNAENNSAYTLALINTDYGHYLGQQVKQFITKYRLNPDFISSHGHTIFHQPENKLTLQIGSGAAIAAECGLPVVCDFRSKDIALGGQGAPLVPIGDELLFNQYSFCLNIGGFANVSFSRRSKRLAYDICPANIVLNFLAGKLGKKYDNEGMLARKGKVDKYLITQLNNLSYYKSKTPKSLGKEWVVQTIFPLLKKSGLNPFDQLRTFTEHAAIQIANACKSKNGNKTILITGGGAYNFFLIERIKAHTNASIVIPDKKTIEFKEAIIFALLGLLRMRGEINCLHSVTAAKESVVGGCVYL